jgi:hypothetical protein
MAPSLALGVALAATRPAASHAAVSSQQLAVSSQQSALVRQC